MDRPVRILVLEDRSADAELMVCELRLGGYDVEWSRVDDAAGFQAGLDGAPDLILADYSLPQFDAVRALELLQARGLDTPLVIVTASVSEDVAVDCMRRGAADYLLKDRLARLPSAVGHALEQRRLRADRKRAEDLERQLLIADRLSAMGTLAAGVAHEINNPLSYVVTNLDLLAHDLAVLRSEPPGNGAAARIGARARERLDMVRDGVERIRVIVRDLKVFSRSDEAGTGPVDIQRVLDAAVAMVGNEIRHRARLVRDPTPLPAVMGNESRLGQVFLNLLLNAAQAIHAGHAGQNEIRITARTELEGFLAIEVADTGCGIPADNRARLFEPFFTTKPSGVGTGLGLAISRSIVQSLGGEITVESEVGRGTLFRVRLPLATPADGEDSAHRTGASRGEDGRGPDPAEAHRRGRILIIDDEEILCATLQIALEDHIVETTTNARAALDRIAGGDRFDIVFCDLMMPEMGGADFHDCVAEVAPGQAERIVFMTGGAFTQQAQDFLGRVRNARIEKPFDLGQFLSLVERRLAGAAS